MKRPSKPNPATPDLLDRRVMLRVREVSDLCGIPPATIYSYVTQGKLPAVRVGSSIRIPAAAIRDLVA
ncbi:MAG: helix-turn-helix domain-containing protein [Bryobacterales bacterium]|nr:helix-turn-helix domain-containing protein [Bryobacterales bacterium]